MEDNECKQKADQVIQQWRAGGLPARHVVELQDLVAITMAWWLLSNQRYEAFMVGFAIWMALHAINAMVMLLLFAASKVDPAVGVSELFLARWPIGKFVFSGAMDAILIGTMFYYDRPYEACALIGMYMVGYGAVELMRKRSLWIAANWK